MTPDQTASHTPPLLSLCVPTYNRARYLDSLLGTLATQMQDFPYPYEIVDLRQRLQRPHTPRWWRAIRRQLPIRYLRHAEHHRLLSQRASSR